MGFGAENLTRIKLLAEIGNTCALHKNKQITQSIKVGSIGYSRARREFGRGASYLQ